MFKAHISTPCRLDKNMTCSNHINYRALNRTLFHCFSFSANLDTAKEIKTVLNLVEPPHRGESLSAIYCYFLIDNDVRREEFLELNSHLLLLINHEK